MQNSINMTGEQVCKYSWRSTWPVLNVYSPADLYQLPMSSDYQTDKRTSWNPRCHLQAEANSVLAAMYGVPSRHKYQQTRSFDRFWSAHCVMWILTCKAASWHVWHAHHACCAKVMLQIIHAFLLSFPSFVGEIIYPLRITHHITGVKLVNWVLACPHVIRQGNEQPHT